MASYHRDKQKKGTDWNCDVEKNGIYERKCEREMTLWVFLGVFIVFVLFDGLGLCLLLPSGSLIHAQKVRTFLRCFRTVD
jgi:hypothetical protein